MTKSYVVLVMSFVNIVGAIMVLIGSDSARAVGGVLLGGMSGCLLTWELLLWYTERKSL